MLRHQEPEERLLRAVFLAALLGTAIWGGIAVLILPL
jgi:hypothetical protein